MMIHNSQSDEPPSVPIIVDELHGNKVVQESWEIAWVYTIDMLVLCNDL